MDDGRKPMPRRVGVLAALLGLSGATLIWIAVHGPHHGPPEPAPVHEGAIRAQQSSGDGECHVASLVGYSRNSNRRA